MGFRLRRSARLGPLRFHFTASGLSSISLGGRGASLNLPVNRRGGPRGSIGLPGTGLSWSVELGPEETKRLGGGGQGRSSPIAAAAAATAETLAAPPRASEPRAVDVRHLDSLVVDTGEGDTPEGDTVPVATPAALAADRVPAGTSHPTLGAAVRSRSAAPLPNSRRLRPSQLEALRRHCLQLFEQQLFRPGSQARQLWEKALVSRLLCDPAIGGRLAGRLALIETRQALTAYLERSRSQDDLKRRCQRCLEATAEALRLCGQRGWLE